MASLTDVFVTVKPDADNFDSDLRRKLSRIDASREGKKVATRFGVGFRGAFGGIASRSASVFAAGFAAVGSLRVFGGFIKEAAESEKIARITANAIRATGGAANVTAADVGRLATSISNKTAIDDEQIQTAANLLLTFKNVRNETGKGNDVFNQATKAAADLSIQFGSMDGASKMLGKALNDPIKGISALSRAGVTFTEQQKNQIETLVKSGKTLQAQKIILGEIQAQVGGAAAAAADPMERLRVIAGNLGEQIGGYLLPYVNQAATWLGQNLPKALNGLIGGFTRGRTGAIGLAGVMQDTGVITRQVGEFIREDVIPPLVTMGKWIRRNRDFLIPFVATIGTAIAVIKIIRVVTAAWAAMQVALNVALTANPIGIVIVAVAALVAGIVVAYKRSETFRKIVKGALDAVASAGKWMWERALKPALKFTQDAFAATMKAARNMWGGIRDAWNGIRDATLRSTAWVIDKVLWMAEKVLNAAVAAFGWAPGIGDKLRAARDKVADFREGVNRELAAIRDENVKVTVSASAYELVRGRRGTPIKVYRREGGPIEGGTPGKDSVPVMAMPGEHYWTTDEVKKVGGHRAMFALRAKARQGLLHLARGGPVVSADTPNMRGLSRDMDPYVSRAAQIMARQTGSVMQAQLKKVLAARAALLGGGGAFGHDYTHTSYGGVTVDVRTARMLAYAARLINARWRMTQGSYNPGGVAASGGTHDGGGVVDIDSPFTRAAIIALRRTGFAAWRRYPSQGPWGTHIHAVDIFNRRLSGAARNQAQAYRAGGDGLGGRDYEPRVSIRGPRGRAASGGGGGLNTYERYIIGRESGGRTTANNPSSTAFGLGQLISANRVAYARRLGLDWRRELGDTGTTSYAAQLAMMRMYIRDRYGSSGAAYRFHRSHGWYDNGGLARGNGYIPKRTLQPERVLSPQQTASFDRLVTVMERRQVGGAGDIHVHLHNPVIATTPKAVEDVVVAAVDSARRHRRIT